MFFKPHLANLYFFLRCDRTVASLKYEQWVGGKIFIYILHPRDDEYLIRLKNYHEGLGNYN